MFLEWRQAMGNFNTQEVMCEIRQKIAEQQKENDSFIHPNKYYEKMLGQMKEQESLIIFGAGKYGEVLSQDLKLREINTVQCFCDNKINTKYVNGLEVLSPQEAIERFPNACYVITPRNYENEIVRQLIHLGVTIDDIIILNVKNTGLLS